jgi:hypothetical protein
MKTRKSPHPFPLPKAQLRMQNAVPDTVAGFQAELYHFLTVRRTKP